MNRSDYLINTFQMLIIVGIITLIGNRIGYDIGIIDAVPGMMLIILIGLISLSLAHEIPLELPSFAYAIFISTVLALPFMPTQELYLQYTDQIEFLATTTPILAYAGLSISLQMDKLKQIGWKLIAVGIFVLLGTFIGSAIVAEIVLRLQGLV